MDMGMGTWVWVWPATTSALRVCMAGGGLWHWQSRTTTGPGERRSLGVFQMSPDQVKSRSSQTPGWGRALIIG